MLPARRDLSHLQRGVELHLDIPSRPGSCDHFIDRDDGLGDFALLPRNVAATEKAGLKGI
jgi:hypothetical protein